jgi:peptidylprolyl isomerase/peptidyl-prolyl cis-trans isomerase B (cyclophilin B)
VSQITNVTYVDFTISYTDANNVHQTGDMVFALFPDFAPQTVSTITNLVNSGFYNNLLVTRIAPGFVIQAGNPSDTASGTPKASPGVSPIDEFNASALFDGTGQLAMANTGSPDTNSSEFFLTNGAQRFLDFKFTLFGQMVRGFDVQSALEKIPLDQQIIGGSTEVSKPHNPVVITGAKIIQDTADAIVVLTPASAGATATINISANDGSTTATGAVAVTGVADATNDPPFLPTIPTQTTTANTSVTFTVNGTDLENEALTYTATVQGSPANATTSVNGNQITVTPNTGFTGTIKVLVGVTDPSTTTADTHVVTVQVNPAGSVAPILATVPTQNTAVNTPVSFTPSTTNSTTLDPTTVTATVLGGVTNVTASVDSTTGQVTVTPTSGFSGVVSVQVGAQVTGNPNIVTENVLVNVNNPPQFGTITNPQVTSINLPVTFHLTSTDTENDPVIYTATDTDSPSVATVTVNGDQVTSHRTPASWERSRCNSGFRMPVGAPR